MYVNLGCSQVVRGLLFLKTHKKCDVVMFVIQNMLNLKLAFPFCLMCFVKMSFHFCVDCIHYQRVKVGGK